nr:nuclear transport factor 2 family protein [Hyphomonas sp. Mor2]
MHTLAPSTNTIVLCEQTVSAYSHARDAVDADKMRSLFIQDAQFELDGAVIVGRNAIAQNMLARANAPTKHLVSSVLVTPETVEKATAISYASVFIDKGAGFTATPEVIVEYQDTFEVTPEACLFSSRSLFVTPLGLEEND